MARIEPFTLEVRCDRCGTPIVINGIRDVEPSPGAQDPGEERFAAECPGCSEPYQAATPGKLLSARSRMPDTYVSGIIRWMPASDTPRDTTPFECALRDLYLSEGGRVVLNSAGESHWRLVSATIPVTIPPDPTAQTGVDPTTLGEIVDTQVKARLRGAGLNIE
jgi:hypothetical protein